MNKLSQPPNHYGALQPVAVTLHQQQPAFAGSDVMNQFARPAYNMSALETLAEVSRQQLDANGRHLDLNRVPGKRKRATESDASTQTVFSDNAYLVHEPQISAGADMPMAALLFDVGDQNLPVVDIRDAQRAQDLGELGLNVSEALMSPATGDVPASNHAETLAEPASIEGIAANPTIDPQLDGQSHDAYDRDDSQLWYASVNPDAESQPLSTLDPFANGLNIQGTTGGIKVRGRFSADRRKEVQAIRKQGACIRCRMLKKPVSLESLC